jgi:hypothetical protein
MRNRLRVCRRLLQYLEFIKNIVETIPTKNPMIPAAERQVG